MGRSAWPADQVTCADVLEENDLEERFGGGLVAQGVTFLFFMFQFQHDVAAQGRFFGCGLFGGIYRWFRLAVGAASAGFPGVDFLE